MSRILQAFLITDDPELIYPLRILRVENNGLSKIPEEIKLLPQLQELYIFANDIYTITSGSLTFNAVEKIVGIGDKVQIIEPGAFAGIYNYFLFLKMNSINQF